MQNYFKIRPYCSSLVAYFPTLLGPFLDTVVEVFEREEDIAHTTSAQFSLGLRDERFQTNMLNFNFELTELILCTTT